MTELRKIHVIGERPAEAPAGSLVLNAPRPLLASEIDGVYHHWQGKFIHGIFYVAVDPEDEKTLEKNRQDDAWEVVYWKREDAVEWAKNYYLTEFSGREGIAEIVAEADEGDLISTWSRRHNR